MRYNNLMMNTSHNPHELVYGYHYTWEDEHSLDKRTFTGIFLEWADRSYWDEYEGKMEFFSVYIIRTDEGEEIEIPDYLRGTRTYKEDNQG